MMETTLRPGDFAYLDSFGGLIPCKVSFVAGRIEGNCAGMVGSVEVTLTASRPGYGKGEVVPTSPAYVIPRTHVRQSSGRMRIRTADWLDS